MPAVRATLEAHMWECMQTKARSQPDPSAAVSDATATTVHDAGDAEPTADDASATTPDALGSDALLQSLLAVRSMARGKRDWAVLCIDVCM